MKEAHTSSIAVSQAATYHGAGPNAVAQRAAVAQLKGGQKTLGVSCNKQIGQNLCWAAVTEAVTGTSQASLKKTYTNDQDIVNDPKQALIDLGKYSSEKASKLTWDTLVDEIDAGRPVIILIGPKKDAHYMLVVGYNGNSKNDKNRKYVISDPLLSGTTNYDADTFGGLIHQGSYFLS
jgi:hypothetical protein